MSQDYIEGKSFKGVDFSKKDHSMKEYENCTFSGCNFSNTDISDQIFVDCSFENCDFTMAKILNTAFRTVQFNSYKLLGMHFEDCNKFLLDMQFDSCVLNLSSFYQIKLKKTVFKDCSLHEADFTEADLSSSKVKNCDLAGAVFENTNLHKVDFRTSFNFSINPESNNMQKAKFSLTEIGGLLDKYDIEIE